MASIILDVRAMLIATQVSGVLEYCSQGITLIELSFFHIWDVSICGDLQQFQFTMSYFELSKITDYTVKPL